MTCICVQAATEAINDYQDALKAATDPVFKLEEALDKVSAKQANYAAVVEEFGPNSEKAAEASWSLAKANTAVATAAANADLDMGAFYQQMIDQYEQGNLTEAQFNDMTTAIGSMATEADAFVPPDMKVNIDLGSFDEAKRRLDGLARSRAALVNVPLRAQRFYASGGVVGAAASGGVRSGQTVVGEDGPELVDLAAGSQVTPAGDTARILGQSGGGGSMHLTIDSGGSRMDDLLVEIIRKAVRVRGGDVQGVLG